MIRALASALLLVTPAAGSAAADEGESALYRCADGREVEVVYGGDVVVLTIGQHSYTLDAQSLGAHARYAGAGWQWSSKGPRAGSLAPLPFGQAMASAAGIACAAK